MIKFKNNNTHISDVNNVTLIVGECPGKPNSYSTYTCFERSRTGNFISDIIKGVDNVFLTNAYNYYCDNAIDKEIAQAKGLKELSDIMLTIKPKSVIALGKVASKFLDELDVKHHKFAHPSYIMRFNKDIEEYKKQLLLIIKSKS